MAIKLQSPKVELQAIYSITNAKPEIRTRILARISEAHFNHTPAKQAWRRIRAFIKAKGQPPTWDDLIEDTALSEESRGILSSFVSKRKVRSPEDVSDLMDTLDKYRRIRGHMELANSVADFLESEDGYDPDEVDGEINKILADMGRGASLEDQLVIFGTDSNSQSLIDDTLDQTKKPHLVKTGFKTYDDVNGGVPLGGLMVVAGTTGGGKSTVASVQMLMNMAIQYPSALVPLEMGASAMSMRLAANLSGVDLGKIIQKKLTENEVKKIHKSFRSWEKQLEEQDSKYTILDTEQDMTIEEILYGLEPFGYRVILIDYISLLKGVDGDDQWKQLGAAARFAFVWARRNNALVVLLAQLSEEGMLRYSKTVGEHAANLWKFVATQETKKEGIIKIEQGKARNQDPFPFTLGIDYATMRVFDLDNPPPDLQRRNLDDDDDEGVVSIKTPRGARKSKSRSSDDDDDRPTERKRKPLLDDDDDD